MNWLSDCQTIDEVKAKGRACGTAISPVPNPDSAATPRKPYDVVEVFNRIFNVTSRYVVEEQLTDDDHLKTKKKLKFFAQGIKETLQTSGETPVDN